MRISKFILIFSIVSMIYSQDYIDVVTLKNGDIIKGKIIENVINDHIRIELQGGSILIYQYTQIEKITVKKTPTRTFGTSTQVIPQTTTSTSLRDCYNDGYASGQSVGTGSTMIGGFVGGFTLGIIGWGISYAIVAGGDPQPQYYELDSLEESCKIDYRRGYKEGALKVKKSTVHIGGALGTLLIVSLALSSY